MSDKSIILDLTAFTAPGPASGSFVSAPRSYTRIAPHPGPEGQWVRLCRTGPFVVISATLNNPLNETWSVDRQTQCLLEPFGSKPAVLAAFSFPFRCGLAEMQHADAHRDTQAPM